MDCTTRFENINLDLGYKLRDVGALIGSREGRREREREKLKSRRFQSRSSARKRTFLTHFHVSFNFLFCFLEYKYKLKFMALFHSDDLCIFSAWISLTLGGLILWNGDQKVTIAVYINWRFNSFIFIVINVKVLAVLLQLVTLYVISRVSRKRNVEVI